jgi:hypothetical protein
MKYLLINIANPGISGVRKTNNQMGASNQRQGQRANVRQYSPLKEKTLPPMATAGIPKLGQPQNRSNHGQNVCGCRYGFRTDKQPLYLSHISVLMYHW